MKLDNKFVLIQPTLQWIRICYSFTHTIGLAFNMPESLPNLSSIWDTTLSPLPLAFERLTLSLNQPKFAQTSPIFLVYFWNPFLMLAHNCLHKLASYLPMFSTPIFANNYLHNCPPPHFIIAFHNSPLPT